MICKHVIAYMTEGPTKGYDSVTDRYHLCALTCRLLETIAVGVSSQASTLAMHLAQTHSFSVLGKHFTESSRRLFQSC